MISTSLLQIFNKLLMRIFRTSLRAFCAAFPIRGRHRLANSVGKILSPANEEIINIGGIQFPVDHHVEMYRYIYYGIYEEYFVNLLKRIVKQGDIIIEPGANVGYITSLLSELVGKNGKVYSMEPSKICFKKIATYLNKDNIQLMNVAIADIDGKLNFVDKDIVIEHGYSTFSKFSGKKENDSEYEIPTITVDTLMVQNKIQRARLLKLDVEGAELMALNGAKKTLKEKRIDYILVETVFRDDCKKLNEEIYEVLVSNGYTPYLMKKNTLSTFDYKKENHSRHDVIWTCVPQ